MSDVSPQPIPHPVRPGSFAHVLGLMVPAFSLCWKNIRTIIGVSLMLGIASMGWSFVSAAVAPDYSIQGLLTEYDLTADFELEEDIGAIDDDGPYARFDGMSDDEINAYFDGMSEEELEAFIAEAEQAEAEMADTFLGAFAEGFKEGLEEEQTVQGGPIYLLIDAIGQLAIGFFGWIAAYFIMGQSVRENKIVTIPETMEAIRTCPLRFYAALVKKWLCLFAVMFLPILAFVGMMAALEGVGDDASDAAAAAGVLLIIPIVGMIAGIIYGIYLGMKWILIEPIVLFEGARFNEARIESGRLMKGSKRSFFFGYMLIAMVFVVALTIVGLVFGVVGGIALVMLALFSEVLGIIGMVLFVLPFVLMQFIGVFYFIGLVMLVWDALSKAKPSAQ